MHATLSLGGQRTRLTGLMCLDVDGISITVANHCYGCTAGQGSGCSGALVLPDIGVGAVI